jgi:exopolysaccharide biosynthesis polyprenyl glycosylphosphotransferase
VTRGRSIEQAILLEDLLVVAGAMLLARFLHGYLAAAVPGLKPPVAPGEYAHLLLVFLPTWVFASERLGIHELRILTGPRLGMVRRVILAQAWGVAAIAIILVAAQTSLNRSLIALFVLVSTVLLFGAKVLQRRWLIRHRGESTALLVGAAPESVATEIRRLGGRRVERCLDFDPVQLAARLREGPVDEVVIAARLPADQFRRLVDQCAEAGLPTLVRIDHGVGDAMDLGEAAADAPEPLLDLPPPVVETVGQTPYLVYQAREHPVPSLFVKALLDRVLAAALLLLLAPVLFTIALLVLIFIGRPVLFVQRRGGLFGRPFPMLKFRTMHVGADREQTRLRAHNEMDGPVFKMTNDPRTTRFGRLLRRASLDELPQLFNVLAGQMSLVGPRPLPVEETRALHGGHRRRLAMRPGITCTWQVSGRSQVTFAEWMTLDLEYVDGWSLGLDLAILVRTIPAVLSARGAR